MSRPNMNTTAITSQNTMCHEKVIPENTWMSKSFHSMYPTAPNPMRIG